MTLWRTLNQHKFTDKLQGINPMSPSYTLTDSYPPICSKTPNCHQNLEVVALQTISSD